MSKNKTMFTRPTQAQIDEARRDYLDNVDQDNAINYQVDRNAATWRAIKQEIARLKESDYDRTLRNRESDHGRTQYARGALDALDCLLMFGGEEV